MCLCVGGEALLFSWMGLEILPKNAHCSECINNQNVHWRLNRVDFQECSKVIGSAVNNVFLISFKIPMKLSEKETNPPK